MKKLLAALAVLAMLWGVAVYADDLAVLKVSALLKDGLEKNYAKIKASVFPLSDTEKEILYLDNRSSSGLPAILNFFVGFGIGSYIQGDTAGGTTHLITELAALSVIGFGEAQVIGSTSQRGAQASGQASAGSAFVGLGALVYAIAKVTSIFRPLNYARRYNLDLQGALQKYDFSFTPAGALFTVHLD